MTRLSKRSVRTNCAAVSGPFYDRRRAGGPAVEGLLAPVMAVRSAETKRRRALTMGLDSPRMRLPRRRCFCRLYRPSDRCDFLTSVLVGIVWRCGGL